jgi:exonuclease VII small subunit
MSIISSTTLLSGLDVQQRYSVSRPSGNKTDRDSARATVTPDGDTVQISSEAWALFHAQSTESSARARPSAAGDDSRKPPEENTVGGAAETSGSRISVEDQIGQLETEISSLESEIASLEEKAGTDELSLAILVRKQARLQTLQAKLTGLLAKSSVLLT